MEAASSGPFCLHEGLDAEDRDHPLQIVGQDETSSPPSTPSTT